MGISRAVVGYVGASCLLGVAAALEIGYLSPRAPIFAVALWGACVVAFAMGHRWARVLLAAFSSVCAIAVVIMQSGRPFSAVGIGLLACIAFQLAVLVKAPKRECQ